MERRRQLLLHRPQVAPLGFVALAGVWVCAAPVLQVPGAVPEEIEDLIGAIPESELPEQTLQAGEMS